MLRNCEKKKISTATISSTTDQRPQKSLIAMEKPGQDPLKCPRCDSSNTKFCYYNNYSLSQPRHFCKACKRYWTRGGTLRNVPVGGGCRKNKRVKRAAPPSNVGVGVSSAPKPPPEIDLSGNSSDINSPSFYNSLPANINPLELNFPFSRFSSTSRVSSGMFENMPQINGVGLGFSSSGIDYENGLKQTQDFHNNPVLFGSSNFAPSSTMASGFSGLMGYEDMQMSGSILGKEVKMEGENWSDWGPNPIHEQIMNSSFMELYY